MHCTDVESRLVAWQDEELSPGETTQVEEHLERCAACRGAERKLASVDLEPLPIPAHIAVRLAQATEVDHLFAEAERADRRDPFPTPSPWRRLLLGAVEVPTWALLAAAAVLLFTSAFAVQTQLDLEDTRAQLAERTIRPVSMPAATPFDLPAEQFRPASYQPAEDPGYR